jgi:hypothetical protein
MAGFDITNNTIWPLEISLRQIGPLYWGVTNPGTTFRRSTGAVWFTIQATISLDGKGHITEWDAVWPIASVVGALAIGALTGGYGAFAVAGSIASSIGSLSIAGITASMASTLIAGGVAATEAIVISGATLGALTSSAATTALAGIFSRQNASVSEAGCYAGWSGHKKWTISGGPTFKPLPDGKIELVPGKLNLR